MELCAVVVGAAVCRAVSQTGAEGNTLGLLIARTDTSVNVFRKLSTLIKYCIEMSNTVLCLIQRLVF